MSRQSAVRKALLEILSDRQGVADGLPLVHDDRHLSVVLIENEIGLAIGESRLNVIFYTFLEQYKLWGGAGGEIIIGRLSLSIANRIK